MLRAPLHRQRQESVAVGELQELQVRRDARVCVSVSSCCHSAATRQTHIVLLDFTTTTTTAAAGNLLTSRRRGDSGSLSIFNAGDAVLPPALCIRPHFAGWKATSLILPDHSKSIKSLLETPQCEQTQCIAAVICPGKSNVISKGSAVAWL